MSELSPNATHCERLRRIAHTLHDGGYSSEANALEDMADEIEAPPANISDRDGAYLALLRESPSTRLHGIADRFAELLRLSPSATTFTSEPVAWLSPGGDVSRSKKYFEDMGFTNLVPLYRAGQ